MSPEVRLSPKTRRAILEQLSRERLATLAAHFELEVTDRRSTAAHVDAIARKRTLDFAQLLEMLGRDELKTACEALGLDSTGREKGKLVQRILGEPGEATTEAPAATASSVPPPLDGHHHAALKSKLRRFVLDTAGGFRGRDAAATFTSRLLQCFGWPETGPEDATLGASVAVVESAQRTRRELALLWNGRRVLLDVVKHDVMLDYAWKELLRVCLQLDPVPQYVVLTNQRDLNLYDLGRDRETPRLTIALDDLPKYSEAFPFLAQHWVPGTTPTIINVSKVSGEVAELVARLYRSLKQQHPKRERDVVQFTLQCILTMFAEDIGLLPQEYFTSLLYDGARSRDVETLLGDLFRLMSTRNVPGVRAIPFFNGGLFTNPVTLPLGDAQLSALTKASEANWKYVDPHIFGSVFQGIMNDAERHKSGAHYTAHDDIMRVVGPTIVEPWRQRIREAKTLAELMDVRAGLLSFRVLDPACGSGNFLYVAFREMYRLDTELLARIREFPSTQGQGKAKISWGVAIQASNFYGIDINPFAVELAKVTLNIAKKIAFDERREFAADLVGQMELEVDPSLPLDNLQKNIVCADALFTEWPEVDAIVGNPPFVAGTNISGELGPPYVARLRSAFPDVHGKADYCSYWFRRAHERLSNGSRAGLIGTSSVREGATREAALDYIVSNGGTITNAVSSRPWSGLAAVNVSMVNWVMGGIPGPHFLVVGQEVYELASIAPHLQLHADVREARELKANGGASCSEGLHMGVKACLVDAATASEIWRDQSSRQYVRPIADGNDLLTGKLSSTPEFIVDMSSCASQEAAKLGGAAYVFLEREKLPVVRSKARSFDGWLPRWWQAWRPREAFLRQADGLRRVVVCSKHAARPIFAFVSRRFFPTHSLQLFAFDDDYSFGVLQSNIHWRWAMVQGSKLVERIRYTSTVWTTFPWPQEPTEHEVAAVAAAAQNLRRVRDTLMKENGWSLRALHQAAEVAGPHPLKDAQAALDDAVRQAYGMPEGQEAIEFLLELNQLVAEDEAEGRPVQGPGVPRGMDPRDPRWMSDDCIEPPPLAAP